MEIAVLAGVYRLFFGQENSFGCLSWFKELAQNGIFCNQLNPLDVVFVQHGMSDAAYNDFVTAFNGFNYWNMLFCGGIGGVADELIHGFSTADQGSSPCFQYFDNVATDWALVHLCSFNHNVLLSFLIRLHKFSNKIPIDKTYDEIG